MKKHILKLGFALAVVVAAGYTVYSSQTSKELTGIALDNMEALASGESTGQRSTCYQKLEGLQGAPMEDKTWCADCSSRPASKWSDPSEC